MYTAKYNPTCGFRVIVVKMKRKPAVLGFWVLFLGFFSG